jgi:hypothetical protein
MATSANGARGGTGKGLKLFIFKSLIRVRHRFLRVVEIMANTQSSILAISLLSALLSSANAKTDEYLCTVRQAAGLHYDDKTHEWRSQVFGRDTRYLLRRLREHDTAKPSQELLLRYEPKANWGFFKLGNESPLAACVESSDSNLSCRPIVQSLTFDKNSGRFELISDGGFIDQGYWERFRSENPEHHKWLAEHGRANDPAHPKDLVFEIGECSPSS